MRDIFASEQRNRTGSHRRIRTTISILSGGQAAPADPTRETKLVEPLRSVILHSQSKHFGLPGRGRQLITIEQLKNGFDASDTFHAAFGIRPLPREKKALEISDRDGLNL